jgi:hypothetical protein
VQWDWVRPQRWLIILKTLPPNLRVLVLSARRSYADTTCEDFNEKLKGHCQFENYQDNDVKGHIPDSDRLFIQFESLHKLRNAEGMVRKFDIVVVDEVEAVLTQAVSRNTNGKRIDENHWVFVEVLKRCDNAFMMDAFISQRTFRFVKHLDMNYKYLNYLRKPVARKAIRFDQTPRVGRYVKEMREKDENRFFRAILTDLDAGKRIYMFVSCKRTQTSFVDSIRNARPDVRILVYNGDLKTSMKNIRKLWQDYDMVITTSTITVGCNFDVKDYFDKCYMHMTAGSRNLVRDAFQCHMRVRHLKENTMAYFLNSTPTPDPRENDIDWQTEYTTREEFEEYLDGNFRFNKKLFGDRWREVKQLWLDVYIDSLVEANHGHYRISDVFNYYLEECNYTVETPEEADLNHDSALVEADPKPDFSYITPSRLSYDQVETLKMQRVSNDINVAPLSLIEKAGIEKYHFDSCTNESQLRIRTMAREELWKVYLKIGRRRFNQARYELGIVKGLVSFEDICKEANMTMWNEKTEQRLDVVRKVCEVLGLKHTFEKCSIPRERIEELIQADDFRKLLAECQKAFTIRDQSSGDCSVKAVVFILNSVFDSWNGAGLTFDKTKQKRVGGKKINITPVNFNPPVERFMELVIPRGSKKMEWERVQEWQKTRM